MYFTACQIFFKKIIINFFKKVGYAQFNLSQVMHVFFYKYIFFIFKIINYIIKIIKYFVE